MALKFLIKEDLTPAGADRFVYSLAPFLTLSLAISTIALIPFGPGTIRIFGQTHAAGHRQRQRRPPDHFRDHLHGRVRRGPGGLVLQQQVFAARRTAQFGADDQLRAVADDVGGGRAAAGRHLQPERISCEPRSGFSWGIFCRAGICSVPRLPQVLGFFCYFTAAVAETNRAAVRSRRSRIRARRRLSHRILQLQVRHVFHGRIRQHDYGLLPGDDPVLRRLAVAVSARRRRSAWTHYLPTALFAAGGSRAGDPRRPLHHGVGARRFCRCWGLVLCALAFVCTRPGVDRRDAGAVLVSAEGLDGSVRLCLGALDAAALPLRSADGLRVEVAASAALPTWC